jgi:hypothetical protein
MLKTLAAKHSSTVTKMARKHRAKTETPHGLRRCFEARIERKGRSGLVARFGLLTELREASLQVRGRIVVGGPRVLARDRFG